jgi:phage terminase large subunit
MAIITGVDVATISLAQQKKLQGAFKQMKEQAKADPIYFIDTFCYTFDPKRSPFHLRFKLFPFQRKLVKDLVSAIENGEDIFIDKTREMGVTYTILATLLWFWLFQPASNFLVGSRKEDYVDNRRGGVTGNKEESLFGKIDYMLSRLPGFMLPDGFNKDRQFTYMSLVNAMNGNVISGESSNPNFSRGGRQKAIFLDEYAFWDSDASVWGATADTTNCRIVATTPGIRPSKAKRLRFGKDGEKIKIVTLDYTLDPRKTSGWLKEQKARRSTEDFDREIMINWRHLSRVESTQK